MNKNKILIVDDTLPNLQLLGNLLSETYSLSFASGGKEALAILEKSIPDLVLLDIMMPEIDGFEVCRRMRNNPLTKEIPIIMLTAKNDKESVVKSSQLGVQDFLIKPFNLEEVQERIAFHIKNSDLLSETEKNPAVIKHDLSIAEILKKFQGIEGELDNVVRVLPSLIAYVRDIEELLNNDEILKCRTIQDSLENIQNERLDSELTSAVHTMSDNMQNIQFDFLDAISDLSKLEDRI